jgi:hypothetical protein
MLGEILGGLVQAGLAVLLARLDRRRPTRAHNPSVQVQSSTRLSVEERNPGLLQLPRLTRGRGAQPERLVRRERTVGTAQGA